VSKDAGEEPIHPAFFEARSEIEFKLAEATYFLEQMRIFQGKARRAQEGTRPAKMVEMRQLFTYQLSAFASAAYAVRELLANSPHSDEAKKLRLREQAKTPAFQFFGLLRDMNTHRRVIVSATSWDLKFIGGKTQIDVGVMFGQKSSNPHMSQLYFSIAPNELNQRTRAAYKELQETQGPTFRVVSAAARYLDELKEIAAASPT
jgi:hypothetical protein